jgi:hypothetical protein
LSLAKEFPLIQERFRLRFEADAFNVFNQPDFDTPKIDASYLPGSSAPPQPPGQRKG